MFTVAVFQVSHTFLRLTVLYRLITLTRHAASSPHRPPARRPDDSRTNKDHRGASHRAMRAIPVAVERRLYPEHQRLGVVIRYRLPVFRDRQRVRQHHRLGHDVVMVRHDHPSQELHECAAE